MKLNENDIRKYLPLQTQGVSAKFEGFEIRTLYKYFPRYLGAVLVDSLMGDSPDADLLDKATPAWIVLTYLESLPFLDIVSTNTGFGVVRSNTVAPASRERVDALAVACRDAANGYMDILLQFLELKANDYPDWNKSCLNEGSLIPDVSVFDQYVDINVSRSQFIDLKRTIIQLEVTTYTNLFSSEFLAELQVSVDNIVKPLVQRALSFHAMGHYEKATNPAADTREMMRKGDKALGRALSYLVKHLLDYPTYATYAHEAPYDNETDGLDSGFFIAGGTA